MAKHVQLATAIRTCTFTISMYESSLTTPKPGRAPSDRDVFTKTGSCHQKMSSCQPSHSAFASPRVPMARPTVSASAALPPALAARSAFTCSCASSKSCTCCGGTRRKMIAWISAARMSPTMMMYCLSTCTPVINAGHKQRPACSATPPKAVPADGWEQRPHAPVHGVRAGATTRAAVQHRHQPPTIAQTHADPKHSPNVKITKPRRTTRSSGATMGPNTSNCWGSNAME